MKNIKSYLSSFERLDDLQYKNLYIIQNPKKYCFTSDAVKLANYCKVKNGGKVVDLCSGSGVIGILVQSKNNAGSVVMVEMQKYLADMSIKSVELNNLSEKIKVINKKLQNISKEIGVGVYDSVVCNPPYNLNKCKLQSEDYEIKVCRHEITVTLEEIIIEASKLLKYGGYFYTVNKEERLTDLMVLLRKHNLEPKELVIVPSSKGSSIIMVKALKDGKSGIKIKISKE